MRFGCWKTLEDILHQMEDISMQGEKVEGCALISAFALYFVNDQFFCFWCLTEMNTRNLPWGKGRPVRKADNLTAICE
jgi:hypothetical protein